MPWKQTNRGVEALASEKGGSDPQAVRDGAFSGVETESGENECGLRSTLDLESFGDLPSNMRPDRLQSVCCNTTIEGFCVASR
jgi:hypothetical protein